MVRGSTSRLALGASMVSAIVSHLFMKACTVAYRDPHMHTCIRTCLHARAVLQRVRVVLVQRSADRRQFCFRVLCHRLCAVLRVPIRRHDLRPHRAVGLQQGEHCSPSKTHATPTRAPTRPVPREPSQGACAVWARGSGRQRTGWVRGGDRNGKWLQVLKHMVFGFLNSKTYSTAPPFSLPPLALLSAG